MVYKKKSYKRRRVSRISRAGNLHATVPTKLRIQLRAGDQLLGQVGYGSKCLQAAATVADLTGTNAQDMYPTHHRLIFNPNTLGGDSVFQYGNFVSGDNKTNLRTVQLDPLFVDTFARMYNTMRFEKVTYIFKITNLGATVDNGETQAPIQSSLNHTIAIIDQTNMLPEFSSGTTAGTVSGWWWGSAKSCYFASLLAEGPRSSTTCTALDGNDSTVTLRRTIDLQQLHGNDPFRKGTQATSSDQIVGSVGTLVNNPMKNMQTTSQAGWSYPNIPVQTTDWPCLLLITTSPGVDQIRQSIEQGAPPSFAISTTRKWSFLIDIDVHYDISFWGIRNPDLEVQKFVKDNTT